MFAHVGVPAAAAAAMLQEDPKVLLNTPLPLPQGQVFERMAWGPDGTIAAALGGHIHFLDSKTGQVRGGPRCSRDDLPAFTSLAATCIVQCV